MGSDAGNDQGCLRCDPLSGIKMSLEASLTADGTESQSISPGLSAGLEADVTEGGKRTGVMTGLFLFFILQLSLKDSKQNEVCQKEAQ